MTFATAMGIAILAMFYAEHGRGVAISAVPVVGIGAVVLGSPHGVLGFLGNIGA